MSTRIISFLQLVQEADPNYQIGKNKPWIYELSNGRLFYQPVQPYTQFAANLTNNAGVVTLVSATGWPTSARGLQPGQAYSNSLVVTVVPPFSPQPGAPALYFDMVNSTELLNINLGTQPTSSPISGSGRLWINTGGILSVA